MELHKLDSKKLGFNPLKTLHFSENFDSTQSVTGLEMWRVEESLHNSQYMECPG